MLIKGDYAKRVNITDRLNEKYIPKFYFGNEVSRDWFGEISIHYLRLINEVIFFITICSLPRFIYSRF